MKSFSATSRRVSLGFAALIGLFGVASYVALRGMVQIHSGLHHVEQGEEGVRTALELASAVRDQYAQQAHIIIIGDRSHLGLYAKARERAVELTVAARAKARTAAERTLVDEIAKASDAVDAIFRDQILPAVLAGDRPTVLAAHARAQQLVSLIQDRADALATRFEAAIGDFHGHAEAIQHSVVRLTIALLAAALLFALAVGAYIVRSIARPIGRLEVGAARLAAGDLDARIDIDTPDEFGRLASQFNAMTAALKANQQRLVQSEKLAGIGRLAAGVAHEISNPLGVILGYVRLMRRRPETVQERQLAMVEDEAVLCQEIVDGLLDLSRPSRGGNERVDLREVCDDVVSRLREAGQLAGLASTVDGAGATTGQPRELRQVVMNLVKNAAEAAGGGGSVGVTIRLEGSGIALRVADSGPGIPAQDLTRLFEPFFTTKPRGTGLGLAVSRAIVQAHGGSLEAVEGNPGAVFILRLPANGRS